jgi:hypothetical protein
LKSWTGNDHSNGALNGWYADPRWDDYIPTNNLDIASVEKEDKSYTDRIEEDAEDLDYIPFGV